MSLKYTKECDNDIYHVREYSTLTSTFYHKDTIKVPETHVKTKLLLTNDTIYYYFNKVNTDICKWYTATHMNYSVQLPAFGDVMTMCDYTNGVHLCYTYDTIIEYVKYKYMLYVLGLLDSSSDTSKINTNNVFYESDNEEDNEYDINLID